MADVRKQPFSLVRLSLLAIAIFFLSAIAVVLALGGVRSSSNDAIGSWRSFADQASAEQRVYRNYITLGGLAGFIDDYGRLVAKGQDSQAGLLYSRAGAALLSINSYPLAEATPEERQAQAVLQANVKAYIARVAPVLAMHRAGRPVQDIATFAKVDSAGVSEALDTLLGAIKAGAMTDKAALEPKGIILLSVREALGVEGVVQYANSYAATGDASDRAKADSSIARVRKELAQYRKHVLLPKEAEGLAAFEAALAAVETRISSGAPGPLDTRALQATLFNVEAIVYAEGTIAYNNLQKTLDRISAQAGGLILLVSIGAILLLAGGAWLLVFRIGRRIKAITQAMRDLASGKLDTEIPAANDRDEIGEMSQALLVFRDGLRANAVMTVELAESSRLASLGAMVAGMAHELNTPLGNALAVSSSLEEQCKALRKELSSERILRSVLDRHAASLADAASLIQRNLTRASEQIGSFKQVAVDQTSGRRREFHLDDVLANVVQTLTPLFKRSPFSIELGEASGAVMESYPGALSQVITNLVENGLKHGLGDRPAGKVEVGVRRLGPNFTEISVSDDGSGIPADVMPSIFHAFFTTKDGKGGSGLGLHIVKSIVSGPLGGQISVQSEPGKGARFILTLPNKAPAEIASAETTERTYYAAAQAAA
ncbi:MAG TPA: HAMP domain-containing sensor histidine kinase [Hyphomonadaceae bacterium]|jgi:signal transduction histidine kinase|nr:HAMP domain-containing sensor histidine kinase [Hyphomonadaceae bacterium]